MKRIPFIITTTLVALTIGVFIGSQTVIEQRELTATGLTRGMSFGTALPTVANDGRPPFDGEPFIVRSSGSDPLLRIYNESTTSWDTTPMLENANSWTGTNVFGNNDADDITMNASLTMNVFREDFEYVQYQALESDGTPAVVTDASVNVLLLHGPGTIRQIGYRIEAPGGPGLAATPAPAAAYGVFTTDGYVDDADNEGIAFTFGAQDNATSGDAGLGGGIVFNETSSSSMYCEAQIDIADISDTDDLWFGWVLNDATDNPPASADFDTYAGFTLLDNTGDLNINTALNDALEGADDTGVDWTDGDQFVLRVTIAADSVSFSAALTDASTTMTAITQTNAVLNADDGDVFKCQLGWTNAAAGDPTVTLEYVEIGVSQ